jgi:hypothetical protein
MGQVETSLTSARRLLVTIDGGGRAGACAQAEAQGVKPCRGLTSGVWIDDGSLVGLLPKSKSFDTPATVERN